MPGLFPHEDMTADIQGNLIRTDDKDVCQPALRVGRLRELGWAATFLASPYARFVTGHTFVVDGANWQRRVAHQPAGGHRPRPDGPGPLRAVRRAMMELPDSARQVIESGRLAHFATINADGSPHVTIVWVGLEGDDIVIGKLMVDQKVRNIRRDPRVALSIEAEGDHMGMQNHLVVEGTATITEGGAPELLHHLAQRYVGPGTTSRRCPTRRRAS